MSQVSAYPNPVSLIKYFAYKICIFPRFGIGSAWVRGQYCHCDPSYLILVDTIMEFETKYYDIIINILYLNNVFS